MTGDFDPGLLPPGLLEGYLKSVQGQIEHLAGLADRLATAGADPQALDAFRRESHKIRGSAGSYGFAEATRVAAEMEEAAKTWIAGSGAAFADRGVAAHAYVRRLRGTFSSNRPGPSVGR